jgi:hypothetical protein
MTLASRLMTIAALGCMLNSGLPTLANAQLPSPAADVAEELLQVLRSGDQPAIRAFVETRFARDFVDAYPLDLDWSTATFLDRIEEDLRLPAQGLVI